MEQIPAAALAMPFDLVRHDLLMDLKPVEPERIHSIVDELFLPLVRPDTRNRRRGRESGKSLEN